MNSSPLSHIGNYQHDIIIMFRRKMRQSCNIDGKIISGYKSRPVNRPIKGISSERNKWILIFNFLLKPLHTNKWSGSRYSKRRSVAQRGIRKLNCIPKSTESNTGGEWRKQKRACRSLKVSLFRSLLLRSSVGRSLYFALCLSRKRRQLVRNKV